MCILFKGRYSISMLYSLIVKYVYSMRSQEKIFSQSGKWEEGLVLDTLLTKEQLINGLITRNKKKNKKTEERSLMKNYSRNNSIDRIAYMMCPVPTAQRWFLTIACFAAYKVGILLYAKAIKRLSYTGMREEGLVLDPLFTRQQLTGGLIAIKRSNNKIEL